MNHILITGGCGFIGNNLILKLSEQKKNKIKVIDNLWRGTDKYIKNIPNVKNSHAVITHFRSHAIHSIFTLPFNKTAIASIFAGSLELSKEGEVELKQDMLCDKIFIRQKE